MVLCGISNLFRLLSPCLGQIVHALLTRPPLALDRSPPPARLACVKHAASVRPEPGSNSDVQSSFRSLPLPLRSTRANASHLASSLANGDSLIFESDCLFFFLLSVSFSRIFVVLATRCRDNVDDYTPSRPLCQYLFSSFLKKIFDCSAKRCIPSKCF